MAQTTPPLEETLTIFISHSNRDDAAVEALRRSLTAMGHTVYEDSTSFDQSEDLSDQIKNLLDASNRVIALVSEHSADSPWVQREIRYAAEREAIDPEVQIIPVLLPGGTIDDLHHVFHRESAPEEDTLLQDYPAEKLAIVVKGDPGAPQLNLVIGQIEGRLRGENYNPEIFEKKEAQPLAELVLELLDPVLDCGENGPVLARLAFTPPGTEKPSHFGESFEFTPPLDKIVADEISFYLERYLITPFGEFHTRKEKIEEQFCDYGFQLFNSLKPEKHPDLIAAWEEHALHPRRFTLQAPEATRDPKSPDNPQNHPAITAILGLPWELLHDGSTYLFDDGLGARVRRFLPSPRVLAKQKDEHLKPPLRVLIVCSRPEGEDGSGYLDHRVSVRPVIEALESLGDLAAWDILNPATLENLKTTLQTALRENRPYHIVHFDGHGVYDRQGGLGYLVFESAEDDSPRRRKKHLVNAHELGAEIANQGVQLFFLEACQSGQAEEASDSSVAGRLLQAGIPSVAAMSHSVLVETARLFTEVFYPQLVQGRRVGTAMLEGQRALSKNRKRGHRWIPREEADEGGIKVRRLSLELDDWFVPILFQHRIDQPVLSVSAPSEQVQEELAVHRQRFLGKLPPRPAYDFVGRSRDLLAAERLLIEHDVPWILFRGEGGEGKTTIATELARWLVQSRPQTCPRAAFVSVETVNDLRVILTQWGEQLLPNQFALKADSLENATELFISELRNYPAILILDNLESIFPPPHHPADESLTTISADQLALLPRISGILARCPGTKLILTSREMPPADSGYHNQKQTLGIGRLGLDEGFDLVSRVLAETLQTSGSEVDAEAIGIEREEEIRHLVKLVEGHARALVLLTPELAEKGLNATSEELAEIMAEMQHREGAGRETCLMASMELSLRRLSPEVREKILPLGVFHGGCNPFTLAYALELDSSKNEQAPFIRELIQVGLAELISTKVPYLRFDPALTPALRHDLRAAGPNAEASAIARWVEAYRQLAGFLYQQRSSDIQLAFDLTRLELPNLLVAIDHFARSDSSSAEEIISFTSNLEPLLLSLNLPTALAKVIAIREAAAKAIEHAPWSKGSYLAYQQAIEQCWAASDHQKAVVLSKELVSKTETAGPDVYPEADYEMAAADFTLSRTLRMAGDWEAAIPLLEKAQSRYEQIVADRQTKSAAEMVSKCDIGMGDCFRDGGQLDLAAEKYQAGIDGAKKLDDRRTVATGLSQLATCRRHQKNYADALRLYGEARDLFHAIGEATSIATIWHQIGIVHQNTRQYEEAEKAYQESLQIGIDLENPVNEASTRDQLGILYQWMGKLEDSVVFHRRAAEIRLQTNQTLDEGRSQNNLAITLIKLDRHDEARAALHRAIKCNEPYGANAEPWKTWNILTDLETAVGDVDAVAAARSKAIHAYAKARRANWQITQGAGVQLCETTYKVITKQSYAIPQAQEELQELKSAPDSHDILKALASQLLRLLDGARDESLWQDPNLYYADAAEIMILLEKLEGGSSETPELSPELFQKIAQDNDIDLASMDEKEKVTFIVQVIAQLTDQNLSELSEEQLKALVTTAESLVAQL